MKTNKFGEMIFDEADLCDLVMQGRNIVGTKITVNPNLDVERIAEIVEDPGLLIQWTFPYGSDISVPAWDALQQKKWFMPETYLDLDIAEYVLSLCTSDAELQRCGEELLLYQERNLFDLLKYLKYLVDVLKQNCMIWGVGRGSSVASFVLYKLEVHKINSLYYDLDPKEFLR